MQARLRKVYCPSVLLVIALAITIGVACTQEEEAYGDAKSISFAENLWEAMQGYQNWPLASDVYPGTSPHGQFLRMYYNYVHVGDDAYHVIVKDNFGGEGASIQTVSNRPEEFLMAVTVMVQRDENYNLQGPDWFYVKYQADGTLDTNEQGVPLAGLVGKDSDTGCMPRHAKAEGGDQLLMNDA